MFVPCKNQILQLKNLIRNGYRYENLGKSKKLVLSLGFLKIFVYGRYTLCIVDSATHV